MKKQVPLLPFDLFWFTLVENIQYDYYKDIHEGLRVAHLVFKTPLQCQNTYYYYIVFACLLLLIKYAYTTESDYGKFTLGYKMIKVKKGKGEIDDVKAELTFIRGNAIVFREDGEDVPVNVIYHQLFKSVSADYDKYKLSSIFIRIYFSNRKHSSDLQSLSYEDMCSKVLESFKSPVVVEPKNARKIRNRKRSYQEPYLTSLKPTKSNRSPFIVADLETVLINDVHVPYAAGFLVVKPCDDLLFTKDRIDTYFSEDHLFVIDTFERRSIKILSQLIDRLAFLFQSNPSMKVVYFHNFSRFDGIILMKHLVLHENKYTIKPLMRNRRLYEIAVYRGNKLVFSLRDSYTLLPNSLKQLATNLCPELGSKGSIPHEDIKVSNLVSQRSQLLEYMKQDIYILGGVMQKAQAIYWTSYNVDVVSKLTVSALALVS